MSWRLFSILVVVIIWASAGSIQPVVGAPLPAPLEVLLGYEASYSQGGRSVVHRGVDLSASEGDIVSSPFSGRVSFAGRVPSPGGGSRNAVTIEFGDGLRATLLPLERIAVKTGQQVSVGDSIGAVAVVAGESTPAPHLHLSVRRGEAYIDPMPFLPMPMATGDQSNDLPQEVPTPVVATVPQTAPEPVRATVPKPVSGIAPQAVMQTSSRTARSSSTSGPQVSGLAMPATDPKVRISIAADRTAQPTIESVLSMTGEGTTRRVPLVGNTEARSLGVATAQLPSVIQQSEAGFQGAAGEPEALGRTFDESAQLPISAAGVVIVAIVALVGLVPIVRGREETSTEDSGISTGEQFAAAVSR